MSSISCLWNLCYRSWNWIVKVDLRIRPISSYEKITPLPLSVVSFLSSTWKLFMSLSKQFCWFLFRVLNSNYPVPPTICNLPRSFVHKHTLLFDDWILLHFPCHFIHLFSSIFWYLQEDFLVLLMQVIKTVKQFLFLIKKSISLTSFLI